MNTSIVQQKAACSHCGEPCMNSEICWNEKNFCCEGCKMVFQLLDKSGLCDYYDLNENPGISRKIRVRENKFAYLEDDKIQQELIQFTNETETHVNFYLPQIHCSSCLYLLENLHKLDPAVIQCKINFTRKDCSIIFNTKKTTLRKIAELLTSIGYEPYISLNDLKQKKPSVQKSLIYQLGVAGFCFSNIMLLSFPEYLGLEDADRQLQEFFRIINVVLALPVFLYSALPFYQSGWKALRKRFLNIDAPIALAVIVTFSRSLYEVITGTGGGYFDSMSGIVFFMLAGRVLQDKTYQHLSFDRDFASYFPIAVSVLRNNKEIPTPLSDLKAGDTILIHNEELIPADAILTRGKAYIDYGFVTGESAPVRKEVGELLYAGGKQTAANIELLLIKEVSQSYLTTLWTKEEYKTPKEKGQSFVHLVSKYFTFVVLTIAACAALYWWLHDQSKVWNVITAVLIVVCPCALLLSNTFTNGNIIRLLARNKLYLKNSQAIEDVAGVTHIVFDKTGTLTTTFDQQVNYIGVEQTPKQLSAIASLAQQSMHPLSKAISKYLALNDTSTVEQFREVPGRGTEGTINGVHIQMGSADFTGVSKSTEAGQIVYVKIDGEYHGKFVIRNRYRQSLPDLAKSLQKEYRISIISGDNDLERESLEKVFGPRVKLFFNQTPEDKLNYIKSLQQSGDRVMMIGDGLNDAGALKQSDAGIAFTDDSNNFTPASDAIFEANQLGNLHRLIRLCKANKHIVVASFVVSIIYNIIGIYFAVRGDLSPMIAAILMPSSSISIILLTYGCSGLVARLQSLKS